MSHLSKRAVMVKSSECTELVTIEVRSITCCDETVCETFLLLLCLCMGISLTKASNLQSSCDCILKYSMQIYIYICVCVGIITLEVLSLSCPHKKKTHKC